MLTLLHSSSDNIRIIRLAFLNLEAHTSNLIISTYNQLNFYRVRVLKSKTKKKKAFCNRQLYPRNLQDEKDK